MPVPGHRPRGQRRAALAAVLVALAGLAATLFASAQVRSNEAVDAQQVFHNRANAAVTVAEQEIGRYTTALRAAGAFYTNAGTEDPSALTRYLQATSLFDQLPTLTSLLFIQRVPEAEIDAFVQRMQVFDPAFHIFDLGGHQAGTDRWILTSYVPGTRDFHIPLGIDVSSLPGLGQQTQTVATTGRSIAVSFKLSPQLDAMAHSLLNGADTDVLNSEFFLQVPAYRGSAAADGRDPDGMVIAAVRGFAESVASAANLQFDDLGFLLTVDLDGLGISDDQALAEVARLEGRGGPQADAEYSTRIDFRVDGIHWTLTAWRGPGAGEHGPVPWLVLGFGALSSLLLGWALYFRTRSAERARLLQQERTDAARFQEDIVQSVADAMVVIDGDGVIVVGNPAWRRLVGDDGTRDDGSGAASYLDVVRRRATVPIDGFAADVAATLAGERDSTEVVDLPVTVDGARQWLAVRATAVGGGRTGAVIVHSDITDRRDAQDSLAERAQRDPLTGLANRDAFAAGFHHAMDQDRSFALLYIDLDRFKQINDQHGHGAGDEVLVVTADRIRAAARADDVIARLGGDEFALLIESPDDATADAVARRIERDIAQPICIGDEWLTPAASIGVALVDPASGPTLADALEQADRAMYAAKHRASAS